MTADPPPPGRPPSWQGAPGYTPPPELPPHAPMPGAPPYPAPAEMPPAPVGRRVRGTGPVRVFGAVAVWAAVHLLLVWRWPAPVPPDRFAAGLLLSVALATLIGWLWARRRTWPFWVVVLAVAPVFWVLRALVAVPLG